MERRTTQADGIPLPVWVGLAVVMVRRGLASDVSPSARAEALEWLDVLGDVAVAGSRLMVVTGDE